MGTPLFLGVSECRVNITWVSCFKGTPIRGGLLVSFSTTKGEPSEDEPPTAVVSQPSTRFPHFQPQVGFLLVSFSTASGDEVGGGGVLYLLKGGEGAERWANFLRYSRRNPSCSTATPGFLFHQRGTLNGRGARSAAPRCLRWTLSSGELPDGLWQLLAAALVQTAEVRLMRTGAGEVPWVRWDGDLPCSSGF